MQLKCKNCGSEFNRTPHYIKKHNSQFCSVECLKENRQANIPKAQCSACGKEIILTSDRRRNSKTGLHFCNRECQNPYVAKYIRWKACSWNNNNSRRSIVLEAARSKCQQCGYCEKEAMLDVHHWDGNHQNNDWDNLRCLCVWCHIGHHRNCVKLDELPNLVSEISEFIKSKQEVINNIKALKDLQKNKHCVKCGKIISDSSKGMCTICRPISRRVVQRPSLEILIDDIKNLGYCGAGRKYNVSDNAIRKWTRMSR